jgi:hypothetical protein
LNLGPRTAYAARVQSSTRAPAAAAEGRRAFGGFIGPQTLLGLVANTAPWLWDGSSSRFAAPPPASAGRLDELAGQPLGWWSVLRQGERIAATVEPTPEQWTDYFVLCVAAHFATVATFVPTDVDTKIRVHLWYTERPRTERRRLCDFVLKLRHWDVSAISARRVDVDGCGLVSGHDGERLSVLCGGLIGLLVAGDVEEARALEDAIDAELLREAKAFETVARRPGRETDLLRLAALLTHNVGDVDQGLSAREGQRVGATQRQRFAALASERHERYAGTFGRAAAVYRVALAADGHRHYPLRDVRRLRSAPELLLPLAPFLDDWGARLATWPGLDTQARAEAIAALVEGCRKLQGQAGYYRALAGFHGAYPGGLDAASLQNALPASVRRELRGSDLRQRIAVRRESFESSLAKKARAILHMG